MNGNVVQRLHQRLDVESICRMAAEETLDRDDLEALVVQVRRLLGDGLLGWYARIQGRETMLPLTLFVVTNQALGEFALAQRKRGARVLALRNIVGYEESRRTLTSRPTSWRNDRLGSMSLSIWLPPGAFQLQASAVIMEEDVRQYPPNFDPDYTLVDHLADFADQFVAALLHEQGRLPADHLYLSEAGAESRLTTERG